jgi:hypothetical protein
MIKLEMVILTFDCRTVITYYDCFLELVAVQCSAVEHCNMLFHVLQRGQ